MDWLTFGATVVGALCVAVPATVTAVRSGRKTRGDIATNHGRRPGEYLEMIHEDVSEVRMLLIEHLRDHEAHSYPWGTKTAIGGQGTRG